MVGKLLVIDLSQLYALDMIYGHAVPTDVAFKGCCTAEGSVMQSLGSYETIWRILLDSHSSVGSNLSSTCLEDAENKNINTYAETYNLSPQKYYINTSPPKK
eukprot:4890135-Amphidinium_carterae.1